MGGGGASSACGWWLHPALFVAGEDSGPRGGRWDDHLGRGVACGPLARWGPGPRRRSAAWGPPSLASPRQRPLPGRPGPPPQISWFCAEFSHPLAWSRREFTNLRRLLNPAL